MPWAALSLLLPLLASAHSASDAYLTLTAPSAAVLHGPAVLHGQWDVALRDLDFALQLDDDGDGRLNWGEVRRHLPQIERYVYRGLKIRDDRQRSCAIKPTGRMIDGHADGSYAVLLFDVQCGRTASITVDYGLFFDIDPSHRGIFLMHDGPGDATALLSPANASIHLSL